MGKALDVTKSIFKAIGEGLAIGAEAYSDYSNKKHEEELRNQIDLPTIVILDAEHLRNLKEISCFKLEEIFKGKTVKLGDDPEVYKELKNFSSFQLEAIFNNDK